MIEALICYFIGNKITAIYKSTFNIIHQSIVSLNYRLY